MNYILYILVDDLQKYVSLCHSDVLSKPPKAMVDYIETSKFKYDLQHLVLLSLLHQYNSNFFVVKL